MKTNQEVIVLAERAAADHSIIRAVLSDWGYRESEIQRFLKKPRVDQQLEKGCNATADHSGKIT